MSLLRTLGIISGETAADWTRSHRQQRAAETERDAKRQQRYTQKRKEDYDKYVEGLGRTATPRELAESARTNASDGSSSLGKGDNSRVFRGTGVYQNNEEGVIGSAVDKIRNMTGGSRTTARDPNRRAFRGYLPETGLIGQGTKDQPFTSTSTVPSGFVSETPVGYVRGAGYKRGDGAGNNTVFAAHDLYNAEQMAQVDANTRASDQHLAYIDRQEAIKKLENKEKNLFRSGSRYRGLSQRRKAQLSEAGSEQIADLREADLDRSIANDVREVGLANANSARFTGQGQIARANADLAVQQSKEGLELAKLDQEDRQFRLGRTTSPKEAAQFMNNIYKSLGDSFGIVINDPETRALVTSQAMSGMTVQDIAKFLQSQGLNESGV